MRTKSLSIKRMMQHIHSVLSQKTNKKLVGLDHFEAQVLMKNNSQLNLIFTRLGFFRPLNAGPKCTSFVWPISLRILCCLQQTDMECHFQVKMLTICKMNYKYEWLRQHRERMFRWLHSDSANQAKRDNCFCETRCYPSTIIAPIKCLSGSITFYFLHLLGKHFVSYSSKTLLATNLFKKWYLSQVY